MSAGRQNTDSTKRTLGIRRQIIFEPRQFFILFAFLAFFSGFLPFIVEKQFRERSCLIGRWLRDGTLNRPWLLRPLRFCRTRLPKSRSSAERRVGKACVSTCSSRWSRSL